VERVTSQESDVPATSLLSTLVGAGTTLLSSHAQTSAIDHAQDAQTAAYNKAIDLQQQQYNQQRQDYAPWRAVGLGALQQLAQTENIQLPASFFQGQVDSAVATASGQTGAAGGQAPAPGHTPSEVFGGGVPGAIAGGVVGQQNGPVGTGHYTAPVAVGSGTTVTPAAPAGGSTATPVTQAPGTTTPAPTSPNAPGAPAAAPSGQFGAFYASPDYKFRVQEGQRAITGNKAAAGLLDAGSTGQGLINYGEAAGSQEFGNWYNRIAALAGVGQTATDSSTAAGAAAVNNQTSLINSQGNNLASSYLNKGQVSAGLISNLGGMATGLINNTGAVSMFGGGGMSAMGGASSAANGMSGLFGSPI
jgi:hypothetical protein